MSKKNSSKCSTKVKRVKKKCIHFNLKNKVKIHSGVITTKKEKSFDDKSESNNNSNSSYSDKLSDQNNTLMTPDITENSEKNKETKENLDRINIIMFKNGKNIEKNILIKEIKNLFNEMNYKILKDYAFPYINYGKFNNLIIPIDLKVFRALFFYCPICKEILRNYSIAYHIFQNHFSKMDHYLSQNEIANGCATLLEKEYRKIKNSLENFGELAVLFKSTKVKGLGFWIYKTEQMIEEVKKMNFEKLFFQISLKEVKANLEKKLPLNQNKNTKRKHKEKDFDLLMLKSELKNVCNRHE